MLSHGVGGPKAWAVAALLAFGTFVPSGRPAAAEAMPPGPQVTRPEAPAPPTPARTRRVARAEAPLPPVCDGPGPSLIRRIVFNQAELEDPAAQPALQSAVQICINAAPMAGGARMRGPVLRG